MLEFIYSPKRVLDKPALMILEAVYLVIISIIISLFLLPKSYVSMGVLGFVTIGSIPLFNKMFSYSSYLFKYKDSFFVRHKKLLLVFLYFFLGLFIIFSAFYLFSTPDLREVIFSVQHSEVSSISKIRGAITGQMSGLDIDQGSMFTKVFSLVLKNNFGVVLRAMVLSLFYGAGAIFLIAWNASILATVISAEICASVLTTSGIFTPVIALFNALFNFLGYLPHGLPEMLAYFVISFAGALLSRNLLKGLFRTEYKFKVMREIIYLVLFGLFLLVLGALIEACYFI